MSKEDVLNHYPSLEAWEKAIERQEPHNLAVETIRDKTKRLEIAREWLESKDSTLFFQEPIDSDEDDN